MTISRAHVGTTLVHKKHPELRVKILNHYSNENTETETVEYCHLTKKGHHEPSNHLTFDSNNPHGGDFWKAV